MPPSPAQTQRSRPRIRSAVAIGSVAVGLLLLLVAVSVFQIRVWSPYRRYVSPALPDGTRYTFLYPKYLNHVREGWHNNASGVMQSVRIDNGHAIGEPLTPLELARDWLRNFVPVPLDPNESITVVVGEAPRKGQGDRKTDTISVNPNGRESVQEIYVVDARSGLRFKTYHDQQVFYPAHVTVVAESIVYQTFRVLPPGSAVPEDVSP